MHHRLSHRGPRPVRRASLLAALSVALVTSACSSGSDKASPTTTAKPTTTAAGSPTTGGDDAADAKDEKEEKEAVTVWEVPENQIVVPATLPSDRGSAEGFEGPDGGLWTGVDEAGDDGHFGVVEPDGTERWSSESTTLAGGTFDVDEDNLVYEVEDTVVLLDAEGEEVWSVELNEGTEVEATALTDTYVLVQVCPSDDTCGWSAIEREEGTAGPLFEVERSEDDATYDRLASAYLPIGEVGDRLVFVGNQTTMGYDLAAGDWLWTAEQESAITPDGTLFNNGFEIDPELGMSVGEYEYPDASDTSTMLTEDSVALVDEDDEELWSYDIEPHETEGVVNNMASNDDMVVVESGDELVVLDRESGELVGTVELDEDTSDIAAAGDAFVVTLDSGRQLVLSFA